MLSKQTEHGERKKREKKKQLNFKVPVSLETGQDNTNWQWHVNPNRDFYSANFQNSLVFH